MNVIFMDETIVSLCPIDLRKRVRRQEGKRLEKRNLVPRITHEAGGVKYWGCISWNGPGPLVEIKGTLDGALYGQILEENIPEVVQNLNTQSPYLIEDNTKLHKTLDVKVIKQRLSMKDLDLPANSPDMNVIETVWSLWKSRILERSPQRLEELRRIATQEWHQISVEDIRNNIKSMSDRIKAVISSRGKNTKY